MCSSEYRGIYLPGNKPKRPNELNFKVSLSNSKVSFDHFKGDPLLEQSKPSLLQGEPSQLQGEPSLLKGESPLLWHDPPRCEPTLRPSEPPPKLSKLYRQS
jgi:hypothetical protein